MFFLLFLLSDVAGPSTRISRRRSSLCVMRAIKILFGRGKRERDKPVKRRTTTNSDHHRGKREKGRISGPVASLRFDHPPREKQAEETHTMKKKAEEEEGVAGSLGAGCLD